MFDVVYFLKSNNKNSHQNYILDNMYKWLIPSIDHCANFNTQCRLHILTDIELKGSFQNINVHNLNDYLTEDIKWFDENYIHLSSNQYEFEKNAIFRIFYLRNFCVINKISNFLHIEPDVLVFSDIIEDMKTFSSDGYSMTLIHNLGSGVNFLNGSEIILSDICNCVINSYSNPQINPKAFDINSEKQNYEIAGKSGGVSDMHFWKWFSDNNPDKVFKEMDSNLNGIFFQTFINSDIDESIYSLSNWEYEFDNNTNSYIKKINIENNVCYSKYKGEKVRIKYLHFHGNRKQIIPNYVLQSKK